MTAKTPAAEKGAPRKAGAGFNRYVAMGWTLVVTAILAELFLMTWCRVQSREISCDMAAAYTRQAELLRIQEKLRVELAHLASPERIMKIAFNQFGLSMPAPDQVVVIHE